MITTDDPKLAETLRTLRVHGSTARYHHSAVGINSRLDTIQAAILLVKLRYLEQWTERRRENASIYRAGLAANGEEIAVPVERPGTRHVYNQFTIRVPRRDDMRKRLEQAGVGTEVYYPIPLHLQECFAGSGYREGDFPVSERAARGVLSLPIDPGLTPEEIGTVVAIRVMTETLSVEVR